MRDVLPDYDRLAGLGRPVGRAVVTSVWGSAPRPEGSSMLATADGLIAGSVSGGCVEGATVTEIAEAIGRGTPKLVTFGVSDERAWEVGLACGGTIKVFVEPMVRPEVVAAARGPGGEVVATVLEGPEAGTSLRVFEDGRTEGSLGPDLPVAAVRDAALLALRREAGVTTPIETGAGPVSLFLEVFPRPPRLVILGGVHIAVALVPLARALGYRTVVAPMSSSCHGPMLPSRRSPSTPRAMSACCPTTPSSTSPRYCWRCARPRATSGRSGRGRPRRPGGSGSGPRGSRTRRSRGCTGPSVWTWAGASRPRRRWRSWRR
jgi:xanthine dehydrogenase accessory factor